MPNKRAAPKPRRKSFKKNTACLTCRKRKLKCDTVKPMCGACSRSCQPPGTCEYDSFKTKIQVMSERVVQLELMIKAFDGRTPSPRSSSPSVSDSDEGSYTEEVDVLERFILAPQTVIDIQLKRTRSFRSEVGAVVRTTASLRSCAAFFERSPSARRPYDLGGTSLPHSS